MTAKQYEKLSAPLRRMKYGKQLLLWTTRLCSAAIFVSYPLFLLFRLLQKDSRLILEICVPAVSFVLLSLIRRQLNFLRPYEALDIDPLIHKSTKGRSFPSRHVFSSFMIAWTVAFVYPVWGCCLLAVSLLLAFCRILAGVHFPRDVLAGIGCAALAAAVYLL